MMEEDESLMNCIPINEFNRGDEIGSRIPASNSRISIFAELVRQRYENNRSRRMIVAIWNKSARHSRATPEIRLQVTNLTRQTVLASCVEVAGNGEKRRRGLLGRDRLSFGEGLWIIPCEAVHTIGMRFPIDLVYLDRAHRIKKVRTGVSPWRLSACLSAHSVLELAGGTLRDSQSRPGDRLEFSPAIEPGKCTTDML
jgi:hypothetical protein